MTVAIAIIAKNEARVLGRCLESVRGAVDEIIVVDTGSDDATKEIARRHGACVFDFAWRDDFAASRQFAFDQAASDWVCWVDADDVIVGADQIRPMLEDVPATVAGFYWRYVLSRDAAGRPSYAFWRERCVRHDGTFRWVGRVHEVLVAQRPAALVRSDRTIVEHHPDPSRAPGARRRNLRILEAECSERTGEIEPRKLFYLGREYADHGDTDLAIATLTRYLEVGQWADERYLAQIQIADLYRANQDYDRAIDADLAALKIHPRWPDAYFGLARTNYFLEHWPNVIYWSDLGRALPPPDTLHFVNTADYSHGWIIYYTNALYRVGDLEAALAWTERALELAPDDAWHVANLGYFRRLLAAPRISLEVADASGLPTYAVIPVRDRHDMTAALLSRLGLPKERVVIVDNCSARPARAAFADAAVVLEHDVRNISELWNVGLDYIAARQDGCYNVAVLNNDLDVLPGFLTALANGLRAADDHIIAYPDHERRLPAGICDPVGRMSGYAFMVRGELGLRADPRFVWWYGDNDLERRARAIGEVVCVGGLVFNHLEHNASTVTRPELQAIAEQDWHRFEAKWS